ncbi:MAG: type-F conjugative transfer system secretin TraK [Deltaproteobacteria bacterium]|nr:type-F conjugative transfer system secretin TraK [Deltaproteobacteria bacterium]
MIQALKFFDKGYVIGFMRKIHTLLLVCFATLLSSRELEYSSGDLEVFVMPGEATQIQFPDNVAGGYKKQGSVISVDKAGTDLIIFAQDKLPADGEVVLVRLQDGRSYSVRVKQAPDAASRDATVVVRDSRPKLTVQDDDELPKYRDRQFLYPNQYQIAGLMRELVLVTEFGKAGIPGYRISESGAGQVVVNDGRVQAKLLKMYLGPQLWGYVLEAENKSNEHVKIDPALFKVNGTRAVSMNKWELAPASAAGEDSRALVYVITKAR